MYDMHLLPRIMYHPIKTIKVVIKPLTIITQAEETLHQSALTSSDNCEGTKQ